MFVAVVIVAVIAIVVVVVIVIVVSVLKKNNNFFWWTFYVFYFSKFYLSLYFYPLNGFRLLNTRISIVLFNGEMNKKSSTKFILTSGLSTTSTTTTITTKRINTTEVVGSVLLSLLTVDLELELKFNKFEVLWKRIESVFIENS